MTVINTNIQVLLGKGSPTGICIYIGQFAKENYLNYSCSTSDQRNLGNCFYFWVCGIRPERSWKASYMPMRCHHFFIDARMVRGFTFPQKKTHGIVVLSLFFIGTEAHEHIVYVKARVMSVMPHRLWQPHHQRSRRRLQRHSQGKQATGTFL